MMEEVEVSAKTVEEAIQLALAKLGLDREQVEVTVLKKGKSGFLGLRSGEARVKVRPLPQPAPEQENVAAAKAILEGLLQSLSISAGVEVSPQAPPEAHPGSIALEIRGQDLGILIGRRGQTLSSIQYLVNVLLAHRLKRRQPVFVDVEGYKKRRYQALRSLAERMAERVRGSGQPITLEPMPAHERRIVHLALMANEAVTTQSIGEGEARKIMILPKMARPRR
ncbi:MAG TPA: protein jag [Dehalococcoidia bacterium]|nr:protein jag [Dehalococcoidia bacterium]